MTRLDDILLIIERGQADQCTVMALRYMTDNLFECPACHRLCETLFNRGQMCSGCIRDTHKRGGP